MSDLDTRFHEAQANAKLLTTRPDNVTLLQIYALYKQATEGDNEEAKPGFADIVARAKWDAWKKLEDTSADEAKTQYIALIDKLRAG
ncbi:MAG: acyl-CoA-binding protein [Pseudomonadota bacterium]|nr:acyl-CoA-binding protein [Pseudomonadota bacterium]